MKPKLSVRDRLENSGLPFHYHQLAFKRDYQAAHSVSRRKWKKSQGGAPGSSPLRPTGFSTHATGHLKGHDDDTGRDHL